MLIWNPKPFCYVLVGDRDKKDYALGVIVDYGKRECVKFIDMKA